MSADKNVRKRNRAIIRCMTGVKIYLPKVLAAGGQSAADFGSAWRGKVHTPVAALIEKQTDLLWASSHNRVAIGES